ncbi:HAD family hydrolase [Mangrovitalea sediminis]|uniref:HAD family hydrolase n=1 Tax=Mangrovitalea sediminis TaxID=1982043 RepID=UPI000BE5076E|nr:HAD family hydrolase [Mangrovitalea sediminis]
MKNDWIGASEIFQTLQRSLESGSVRVVSFDLFDTLIRRKCSDPTLVFERVGELALAEGLIAGLDPWEYRHMRCEAERQARSRSSREDIRFEEIFDCLALEPSVLKRLRELELQVEREVIKPDPMAFQLLRLALTQGASIALISDMYLPEQFLMETVSPFLPEGLVNPPLFVSSTVGYTKHSSRLFRHVIDKLNVQPGELLHIGDNIQADFRSAVAAGCRAIHFEVDDWVLATLRREDAFNVGLPLEVRHARRSAALCRPDELGEKETYFFLYGACYLGPVLAGFSRWLVERSRSLGVAKVVSLMREGALIRQCMLAELAAQSDDNIDVCLAYVSRRSTYLPALDLSRFVEDVTKVFQRRNYTLGNLIAELGMPSDEQWIKDFAHLPVTKLASVAVGNTSLLELLGEHFRRHEPVIYKLVAEARSLLSDYFGHLLKGEANFVTVDMGPGGTIQTQMNSVLEPAAKQNFLLYANERAFERATQVPFSAFLPMTAETKKAIAILCRSPEIFETVMVGAGQSTVGYRRQTDGNVEPVLAKGEYSQDQQRWIAAFEAGVECYQHWSFRHGVPLPDEQTRVAFVKMLERLVTLPHPVEVAHLGDLVHEDNFGTENSYTIINDQTQKELALQGKEIFWRRFSRNINEFILSCPWPQGDITKVDEKWISEMLQIDSAYGKHQMDVERILGNLSDEGVRNVVVYGAGEFFLSLLPGLRRSGIAVDAVVDGKAMMGSFNVEGFTVRKITDPEVLKAEHFVIASAAFVDDIRHQIDRHHPGSPTIFSV